MISFCALFAAAFLAAEGPGLDVDRLLAGLRDEGFEAREAATQGLRELLGRDGGDAALYRRLKKARAGEKDLEVRERVAAVLRTWPEAAVAWRLDLGAPIDRILHADGDRVIVVTRHNIPPGIHSCELRLRAVSSRTGEPAWEAAAGTRPAEGGVAGGRIVLVTAASEIASFDAKEGRRVWTAKPPPAVSSPVLDGDRVFVGGNHGVAAYDAATGKPVWSVKGKGWFGPPLIQGDDLIAGSVNEGVWRLSKAGGKRKWASDAKGAPSVVAGDLLICEGSREIQGLRLADGARAWIWNPGMDAVSNMMGIAGGRVIVRTGRWRTPVDSLKSSMEFRDFELHALDEATGKEAWSEKLGDAAPSLSVEGDWVRVGETRRNAATGKNADSAGEEKPETPRWSALGFEFVHDEPVEGDAKKATVLRAVRLPPDGGDE